MNLTQEPPIDMFAHFREQLDAVKVIIDCKHDMEELDEFNSRCKKNCGLEISTQDILAEGHYDCTLDTTEDAIAEFGAPFCQDHGVAIR
jgi:hypothetical protein